MRFAKLTALLFLIGIVTYSNALNGSFHFDDIPNIVNNVHIRNILNLKEIWEIWPTRFTNFLTLSLNYHFGALNVTGYHALSLLIHISSSLLVAWLILMTTRSNVVAFFTGAIFLCHPLQTQAVNYLTQRSALLVAFFYLSSLCLYVKARQSQQGKSYYIASIVAAIIAFFSKETAISLPFMVFFYEYYFLRNQEPIKWKLILPFLAVACLLPMTWLIANPIDFSKLSESTISYAGGTPIWQYLITQLKVIVTYLRLIFIPINQAVDYNYPLANSFFELLVIFSFVLLASILTISIVFRNNFRVAAFGVFWFFITLLPESSLWPNKDVIFEHRLYLPMVGFSLFISSIIHQAFKDKKTKWPIIALSSVVVICSVLTFERNKVWVDEFSLWDDSIKKSPNVARAYLNRGVAYERKGLSDLALKDFNKALEIGPEDAIVYSNRGAVKKKNGDLEGALRDLNRAIETNPSYAGSYTNRGSLYLSVNQYELAIADFNKVLSFNPYFAEGYRNRGRAYLNLNMIDKALVDLDRAIELRPDSAEGYNNRGIAYANKGDFTKALENFDTAIKIEPMKIAEAYNNRGMTHYKLKNLDLAILDLDQAIDMAPKYAQAYLNRSTVHYTGKKYKQSLDDLHKAQALGLNGNPIFIEKLKKAAQAQ